MHPLVSASIISAVIGCLTCNSDLRTAIFDHRFTWLCLTVAPVTVIGGVLAGTWAAAIARGAYQPAQSVHDQGRMPWAPRRPRRRSGRALRCHPAAPGPAGA